MLNALLLQGKNDEIGAMLAELNTLSQRYAELLASARSTMEAQHEQCEAPGHMRPVVMDQHSVICSEPADLSNGYHIPETDFRLFSTDVHLDPGPPSMPFLGVLPQREPFLDLSEPSQDSSFITSNDYWTLPQPNNSSAIDSCSESPYSLSFEQDDLVSPDSSFEAEPAYHITHAREYKITTDKTLPSTATPRPPKLQKCPYCGRLYQRRYQFKYVQSLFHTAATLHLLACLHCCYAAS